MRCVSLLLAVLLIVPLLGSGSPKGYDDKTTLDPLDGTWELVAVERQGRNSGFRKEVLTYHGGKYTFTDHNSKHTGTYTSDSSRNPGTLEYKPAINSNLEITPRIFHVDGDTLRTAFIQDSIVLPTRFDDKKELTTILTFKCVK